MQAAMGVGKGFWEQLRPVKQTDDSGSLWGKRLAVDLSFWLIQQQKAVKDQKVRKPHLRLTFYRVVNLVARLGARPVFIVDGEPPYLKKVAQNKELPIFSPVSEKMQSGLTNSKRNTFLENVEECVVLLKTLGMPVLQADGEAEKLCAELNREGLVDACLTPDSDAFLHGAKCVIKSLQTDHRDTVAEFYWSRDIEEKLGLQQNRLVALALLVGCDYKPEGVRGLGYNSALRFVRCFPECDILDRLRALGHGELSSAPQLDMVKEKQHLELDQVSMGNHGIYTHCSKCAHLGNKREHAKVGCPLCGTYTTGDAVVTGCDEKPKGFRCSCQLCLKKFQEKAWRRTQDWWIKTCNKISSTPGFPDEQVIEIFLKRSIKSPEDTENFALSLTWGTPNMEDLQNFLGRHLLWDATYISKKSVPLLAHFCLTELAAIKSGAVSGPGRGLVMMSKVFHPQTIQCLKIHHSEPLFVLKWISVSETSDFEYWQELESDSSSFANILEREEKVPGKIQDEVMATCSSFNENGGCYLTTTENFLLVKAACPELTEEFLRTQVLERKRKRRGRK